MTETGAPALLEPSFLARLERLRLATPRRLNGVFAGEHPSPRYGSSVDFADHRPYSPGDDPRMIDHHVYARLDVLRVKRFEALDELHVRLLCDTSASMRDKLEQAKRICAAFGFVALRNHDPLRLETLAGDVPARRFTSRSATPTFFRHLAELRAAGPTPLREAASRLLARSGPPGLTILVSDLLTEDWEAGLGGLRAGGSELLVVHVLAPSDLAPAATGDVDLIDRETGERVGVTLSPQELDRFRRIATAWTEEVAAWCRRWGSAYLRVRSDEDLEPLLFGAWRRAGVLR